MDVINDTIPDMLLKCAVLNALINLLLLFSVSKAIPHSILGYILGKFLCNGRT